MWVGLRINNPDDLVGMPELHAAISSWLLAEHGNLQVYAPAVGWLEWKSGGEKCDRAHFCLKLEGSSGAEWLSFSATWANEWSNDVGALSAGSGISSPSTWLTAEFVINTNDGRAYLSLLGWSGEHVEFLAGDTLLRPPGIVHSCAPTVCHSRYEEGSVSPWVLGSDGEKIENAYCFSVRPMDMPAAEGYVNARAIPANQSQKMVSPAGWLVFDGFAGIFGQLSLFGVLAGDWAIDELVEDRGDYEIRALPAGYGALYALPVPLLANWTDV